MSILFTTDNLDEANRADIVGHMDFTEFTLQLPLSRPPLNYTYCRTLRELSLELWGEEGEPTKDEQLEKPIIVATERAKEDPRKISQLKRRSAVNYQQLRPTSRRRIQALVMRNFGQSEWFLYVLPIWVIIAFIRFTRNDSNVWMPVAVLNSDSNPIFSRYLLESLSNRTIVLRLYSNLEQALASMERNENWALMNIPSNFSTVVQAHVEGNGTNYNSTLSPTIDIDSRDFRAGFILRQAIYESFTVSIEPSSQSARRNLRRDEASHL